MRNDIEVLEQGNILVIPEKTDYWLIRANGGKYVDDFFLNGFIAVSDNEVTLDMLNTDPQLNTEIGRTKEGYKELFRNTYKDQSAQQISHAVSRTMNFIEEMKINDLVIVPSHRSTEFSLGIITSDPYEAVETDFSLQEHIHYSIAPYHKRRDVTWIKTIDRESISEKMYWILSAHQTIFNLKVHAEQIDKLLSPIYIKGDKCFSTVKVNIERGINVNEWIELYEVVRKIGGEDSENIIIKNNVQSPGLIDFIANAENLPRLITLFCTLCGTLFGKVKVGPVEFLGIIPYFFNEGSLGRKRMKIENTALGLDNEKKQIEIDIMKAELSALSNTQEIPTPQIAEDLRVTSFNAGNIVRLQRRRGNDDFQSEE